MWFRSTISPRLVDQFVHRPSGVRTMLMPPVLMYRPPSPSWPTTAGNFVMSMSSPNHLFCLHGAFAGSTMRGGCLVPVSMASR